MGGLLRLKPILTVKDGEAFPVTRVRSRAKALDELFALCSQDRGVEEIAVLHTTTPDDAAELAERAAPPARASRCTSAASGPCWACTAVRGCWASPSSRARRSAPDLLLAPYGSFRNCYAESGLLDETD